MNERDAMFEKAREYIKSGDHEGLILSSDINDESPWILADFALSVQKEIDLEILHKRVQTFLYLQRGHYSYKVEKRMVLIVNIIFEYLKQQPEFKLSEPPRKEEGE